MGNAGKKLRLLGVVLGIAVIAGSPSSALAGKSFKATKEHVYGELIVKMRDAQPGVTSANTVYSSLLKNFGSNSVLSVKPFITDSSMHVVRLTNDANMKAAIANLKANPAVEIAEPNYIMYALDEPNPPAPPIVNGPNDPELTKLWGMKNDGQADSSGQMGIMGSDINVLPLWQDGIRGSRKVLVAVIDTGIEWTHPDLADNLYTNTAEIAGDGKDNDGNGFIDDIHGWNFASNTNQSQDDHGHGSHCSGTIGGVGNNNLGVVGVNWEVSLLPVKFLSASGSGSLQGAVDSINYARMMKVNIMSNSWGGGGFTESLKVAIEKARDAGITFVAAAGNESNNNDASPTYPAGYDVSNVIAVAATDNKDQIASFSNYGSKTVHVAAPGVRVYSSVMGGKYDTYSGTSMATPHVAGIAALLLSTDAQLTPEDIRSRLIKTSNHVPSLKSKSASKGRVNAYNAIHNIVPPNDDPNEADWVTETMVIESAHPYADNADVKFTVSHPGAKYLRLVFQQVDVEPSYDHVILTGPDGMVADDISGKVSNYTSEYVKADTMNINLTSDSSVNGYGFKMVQYQYIPAPPAPETLATR